MKNLKMSWITKGGRLECHWRESEDNSLDQGAKVVDSPWRSAALTDLRIPGTVGAKARLSRLVNWYVARLQAGAQDDERMSIAFQQVTNLLKPPQSLLQPQLVARVMLAALGRRVARNRTSRLEAAARGAF